MPFVQPAERKADAADRDQDVAKLGDVAGRAEVPPAILSGQNGREKPRAPQDVQGFLREESMTIRRRGAPGDVAESVFQSVEGRERSHDQSKRQPGGLFRTPRTIIAVREAALGGPRSGPALCRALPKRDPLVEAVVAIPVRNEAERIAACLDALGRQSGIGPDSLGIVLLVNNTTDDTIRLVESTRAKGSSAIRVIVHDSADANAGWARRGAMDAAATWLEEAGAERRVILTTDADSRVAPDWVGRNLAAIDAGADAVAGTLALDADEAARLSPALRTRGEREAAYHHLLDRLSALIDPDPDDPWPNHSTDSGASLAVTLAAYRLVDGMPPLALGDDRAFVARLRDHGLKVRHDPSVAVVTSARLMGRAAGGVAETMKARQDDPDCPCDGRLEGLGHALRRYRWHRRLRVLHAGGRLTPDAPWSQLLGIPREEATTISGARAFGAVLDGVNRSSRLLQTRPLRPSELPVHIAEAEIAVARRIGHTG